MHNDFLYALDKDLPIFTNTRPDDCSYGKRYILPTGVNGHCKAFVFEGLATGKQVHDFNFILDSKFYFF